MAGYMVYWSKDYVKKLKKAGDTGPFKVVYGSQHHVMPSIDSVKVGDVIFPVTIIDGTLAIMARLEVTKIECAFEYVMRELGTIHSALIPEGVLYHTDSPYGDFVIWAESSGYLFDEHTVKHETSEGTKFEKIPDNITRIYYKNQLTSLPHLLHQEPQTCCAKTAASGNGSEIFPRPIPLETVAEFRFGSTKSSQKPLRFDKNGKITTISMSGFVRKMSNETFEVFESYFKS